MAGLAVIWLGKGNLASSEPLRYIKTNKEQSNFLKIIQIYIILADSSLRLLGHLLSYMGMAI